MSDITACNGENCPLKLTCYRFLADRDERQSVFITVPYKEETKSCSHYWKIHPHEVETMNQVWR